MADGDIVKDSDSKEANEKTGPNPAKKNQNTKWYLVGGLAVIALLVFIFVRKSNSNATAGTTAASSGYGSTAASNMLASILPYIGSSGGGEYGGYGTTGAQGPAGPAGPVGKTGATGKTGASANPTMVKHSWTSPGNSSSLSQILERLGTSYNALLAATPASTAGGKWLRGIKGNLNAKPPKGTTFFFDLPKGAPY
jgi:anaerobic selenocysteine-containing dehydrogenase